MHKYMLLVLIRSTWDSTFNEYLQNNILVRNKENINTSSWIKKKKKKKTRALINLDSSLI